MWKKPSSMPLHKLYKTKRYGSVKHSGVRATWRNVQDALFDLHQSVDCFPGAITGDSLVLKFEKTRSALEDSLRRVEDIVPQAIASQICDILGELEGIEFSLDPLEKQIGDEIIGLLQQGKIINNNSDNNELETFHQAASKLGITSSRTALGERRALKKLVEKARIEDDKRKESIVAYLLHLMRKYSKLFRSEFSDDNDSQGSAPCSPTIGSFEGYSVSGFEKQLSKLNSFNFKPNLRSGQALIPPEELRCPISLQLMYDPVIIASGQTYERICIEKWFGDGHDTCPKTQLHLSHLGLTPNYCVKGLVGSWCEHNGVVVPGGPPESLDLNYWRLSLSESESVNSKPPESGGLVKCKGMKVVPFPMVEVEGVVEECGGDVFERYDEFLAVLDGDGGLSKKCSVVEEIRRLLKDDEEARIYMGANGFVEALLRFLQSGLNAQSEFAQENGAMALFNLAVNNNRNKEMMLASGILSLLAQMIESSKSIGAAIAVYLNLSCFDQAKPIIGSSEAVPFLIEVLQGSFDSQCKIDALHTLYHLSSLHSNVPLLLSSGIISALQPFLADLDSRSWTEKAIAVLINLAVTNSGRSEIIEGPGMVSGLSMVLDMGEPEVQEQAAACLLILCTGSDKCSEMVLQEGVIPSLVSISVNGTMRGKQKAQKLLMVFREQRQRDPPAVVQGGGQRCEGGEERRALSKSTSRRKMGRTWSFWRKSKSFSVQKFINGPCGFSKNQLQSLKKKKRLLNVTMVLTIWELRKWLKHPDLDKTYGRATKATNNYFTLKLHYGGVFTKVPGRKYINGNVAYFDFVDIDLFSVHDINEMVRDIGYLTETPLFFQYCKPNICLDYGLMPLGNDQDVLTMTAYIPRHREISDEPTQMPVVVSPEMDKGKKWSRGGEGSCSKKLNLNEHLVESSQPQSQVINEEVWDPNGNDLVPFVSTQVSQLSQVINTQVEVFVEVVVEGVGTEPEKWYEVNVVTQDDGGKEDETTAYVEDVVTEDVDMDIGAEYEQSLGQQVENDMFAELEDMMDHDYSMIGDIDAQYNVIQPNEDEITEFTS
ncbi:hypothetical protein LXL04_020668 [Taraxacum kok-saghyz]